MLIYFYKNIFNFLIFCPTFPNNPNFLLILKIISKNSNNPDIIL